MEFARVALQEVIAIRRLISFHYAPFGAEQLLIRLQRKGEAVSVTERLTSGTKERCDQDLIDRITALMDEHLETPFSLDRQLNITEISRTLGFSSVHYFSRQFKKTVRMAPSEYAKSVKSKL